METRVNVHRKLVQPTIEEIQAAQARELEEIRAKVHKAAGTPVPYPPELLTERRADYVKKVHKTEENDHA